MRRSAAKGAATLLWAKAVSVMLAQTSVVVLPLFLDPEDFGIFGISIFFVGLVVLVGDFGLGTELIRRSERVDEALATAFGIRILLGLLLVGVSVVIAFVIVALYGDPRLFLATIVASFAVIISAGSLVPRTLALRSLDFKRAVIPDQLGKIALAISAIALAFFQWGYWSLVASSLVGPLVAVIAYKYAVPWQIRWRIDRQLGRTIMNFGRFVTLAAILTFVANSVDKLIIGYAVGLTQLGYYFVAYSWAVGVPSSVQSVLSGVTYPILSTMKDHPDRIRRAFSESLRLFSYVGAFIFAGVVTLAEPFATIVLGAQWTPLIAPMQILSAAGFCLGWVMIYGDLLTAVGKPRLVTWIHAVGLLLVGVTLYPFAILFGLAGAAASASLSLVTLATIGGFIVNRELEGAIGRQLKELLLIPLTSASLAALPSWLAGRLLPDSAVGLGAQLAIFSFSYLCFMEAATGRRFLAELRSFARMVLSKSK